MILTAVLLRSPTQTLRIALSKQLGGNVNSSTALHLELNATHDVNITKNITFRSLTIPVTDIANIDQIVLSKTDNSYAGSIMLDMNDSHDSTSYSIPVVDGTYHILAQYDDNNISYYNQTTNSWGGMIPTTVTISGDSVLASTPATAPIVIYTPPTMSHVYDRVWRSNFGTKEIKIDINDTDSAIVYLSVMTTPSGVITVSPVHNGTSITANTQITLTITPSTATSTGYADVHLMLNDGIHKHI
jgi:hypothetical protein